MVLSRLRRCFSAKSSSSTAYLRLHTPPRPVPIVDEDFKRPEPAPPRPVPIVVVEDFKRAEDAPPQPIPTVEGDGDRREAASTRRVTISEGGSGNEEKSSAMYRLENELRAMEEEAPTHCSFGPVGEDSFRWEAAVIGPAYSCYEGGVFHLSIQFPSDYPLRPPCIKFLTKVSYVHFRHFTFLFLFYICIEFFHNLDCL